MPQNSLNSLFHGHIPPVREFNREMDQQTPSHTPTTNNPFPYANNKSIRFTD